MNDIRISAKSVFKLECIKQEPDDSVEMAVWKTPEVVEPITLTSAVKEEDGEEEDLKPPASVFLDPKDVVLEEENKEYEDPLAVCSDTVVKKEGNSGSTDVIGAIDCTRIPIIASLKDVGGDGSAGDEGEGGAEAGLPLLLLRPRPCPVPLPLASDSPSLLPDDPGLQGMAKQGDPQTDAATPTSAAPAYPTTTNRRKANRTFSCSECGKVFLKSGNYKQHLGMHFVDQKNHKCPVCGQLFAWKSTLNKHVTKVHAEGEPPPRPPCELCGREYATVGQVQEHIRRDHFLQRPHACSVPSCTKRFYKKHDLKVHLRMHNKERPYICGSCGKTFYHLSHIIRHERIHSGLRPYKCPDCGRHFNQSSALKCHRRRHREKEHELQQLQLQFQQQQELEQVQQLNREPDDEDQCLLEEQVLEEAGLEPGLGVVELDAHALETAEDATSLLTSPGLEGTPPEPLVELTVTDAEMVLGLPTSVVFPTGLFPDVT